MTHKLRYIVKGLRHNEAGATLAEFAITCIVLLTALVAVAEFCIALYTYEFVSYSAQQAGQYAIVRGAHWRSSACATRSSYGCNATAADIQNYVKGLAPPGVNPDSITVNASWPGKKLSGSTTGCSVPNSDGCLVKISVSYPFSMHIPLLPALTVRFAAHSDMVIQQ